MTKLIDAFPVLAREVSDSLRALGHAQLADQVDGAVVADVSFDESAGVGYVKVEPSRVLNVVEANIIGERYGKTIAVESQFFAAVDLDNFERLLGIEILAPGVLAAELKRRASA